MGPRRCVFYWCARVVCGRRLLVMTQYSFHAAKRSALRSLALAVVLAPALAQAQAHYGSPAMGAPSDGWAFALLMSLDLPEGGWDVGPRASAEFMYGAANLAPQARLDVGFRPSFAYHSASYNSDSVVIFDFVPDLKLVFGVSHKFALYADFGLGVSILHYRFSGTYTAAAIQPGFGFALALSPGLNLLGEVRFDVYTGGHQTFVAFPTIGLQWR